MPRYRPPITCKTEALAADLSRIHTDLLGLWAGLSGTNPAAAEIAKVAANGISQVRKDLLE